MKKENPLRAIQLEKVTLNIGSGPTPENVEKAVKLLNKITGKKVIKSATQKRVAAWGLRPGLIIGARVTLRGPSAAALLKRLLKAVDNKLSRSCFVRNGFSFGIKEYFDIPDVEYDPAIGIIGLGVHITLQRPGVRIKRRKIRNKSIPSVVQICGDDAATFAEKNFGVKVV